MHVLVLAWLVAQNKRIFVIPGAQKIKYLEKNVGASAVTLTKEEQQELRKLVLEARVDSKQEFGLCGHCPSGEAIV